MKKVVDVKKRNIEPPALENFTLGENGISLVDTSIDNTITVNGQPEPTFEAEKAVIVESSKDAALKYKVLIGDKTKARKALVGIGIDDNRWITFKPVALIDTPSTDILDNGKKVKWKVSDYSFLETEINYNSIKSTLQLNSGADPDNIYFTVKLPVAASLELDQSTGELKAIYGSNEMGHMPRPIGWDSAGNHIVCSYSLVQGGIEVDGITYIGVKINPQVTVDHVYPLYIDPSFSYSYTDITDVHAVSTENWSFDKSGSGKSWSGLAPFPNVPIWYYRPSTHYYYLFDINRSGVWIDFNTYWDSIGGNLIDNSADAWGFNLYSMRSLDGYFFPSGDGTIGQVCSFGENLGPNNRSSAYFNQTGVFPSKAEAYAGNIATRNSYLGVVDDNNFYNKQRHWAVSSPNDCQRAALAKDSNSNVWVLGYDRFNSKFTACSLNLAYHTTLTAAYGNRNIIQYWNDTAKRCIVANSATASAFLKESDWAKTTPGATMTTQFVITDHNLPNRGSTIDNQNGWVYSCVSGSGTIRCVNGAAINVESGSKTWAQIVSDGYGATIGTIGSGETHKIIPNVFTSQNNFLQRIDESNLFLAGSAEGLYCIDVSNPASPTLNGYLTDSVKTGIFSDLGCELLSPSTAVGKASGAYYGTDLSLVFYTASKLYIYGEGNGDLFLGKIKPSLQVNLRQGIE